MRRPTAVPAPYAVMAAIALGAAAFAVAFALLPGTDPAIQLLDLAVAFLLLVLAVVTYVVLPRFGSPWALDVTIGGIGLLACYGAFVLPDPEGQVLIGLGLVLICMFGAYFQPRGHTIGLLVLLVGAYAVALWLNPLLANPIQPTVVISVIVGASLTVSVLAERLRQAALHDPLTGALNRRGLEVMAPAIVATARRSGLSIAVGVFDLDHFKDYNDRRGHAAGDALLVAVTRAWRSRLRAGDLLVRQGGDEFVVVLPGADDDAARAIAQQVAVVAPAAWSIGFTLWQPDEDVESALMRADAEMYDAKRRST